MRGAAMMRFAVTCAMCCLPVLAMAGANPLVNGVPASPGPSLKKQGNVLGKDGGDLPPCDSAGLDPKGGRDCQVVEPLYLPRGGVTDDMLEKYRLKR